MQAGVIHHLKSSQQPITDGQDHLIPLCETIEAIFRNGLKSELQHPLFFSHKKILFVDVVCCYLLLLFLLEPNSWFGLNKQDYWSWIEPLQDYYFNEKQNPLLRQIVDAISASPKVRYYKFRLYTLLRSCDSSENSCC